MDHYQKQEFGIKVEHPEYGSYLNWLYHSDATLTFPQTIYLRYSRLESEDRRQPEVAEDYAKWFIARLRLLDQHIKDRSYLCDERFTIADIAVGYALYLGDLQGLSENYTPQVSNYLQRLKSRPAFKESIALSKPSNPNSII